MSSSNGHSNGVIKIGRKGRKRFQFEGQHDGCEGPEFVLDVVDAFEGWLVVDDQFRSNYEPDADGNRVIPRSDLPEYHRVLREHMQALQGPRREGQPEPVEISTADALDFVARLREQYDELAHFFQPKSRTEPESPATSAEPSAELRFSVEQPAQN